MDFRACKEFAFFNKKLICTRLKKIRNFGIEDSY
jgi:hypothetical protein